MKEELNIARCHRCGKRLGTLRYHDADDNWTCYEHSNNDQSISEHDSVKKHWESSVKHHTECLKRLNNGESVDQITGRVEG